MIQKIEIEEGAHQPKVILDPKGYILFHGRSIVSNAVEFYDPLIIWMESFVKEGGKGLVADFKLSYINTASHKMLIQLFLTIKELENQGLKIELNWYFDEEDEDIIEFGEEASMLTKVKFNMIPNN